MAVDGPVRFVISDQPAEQPNLPVLPETIVDAPLPQPAPLDFFNPSLPSDAPFQIQRSDDLIGQTRSASQGVFGQEDFQNRSLLRPASVLELVPGVVATQHSGSGKANQYFLRGFNLDHGTDFSVRVDGVPINLPTHAHGQGYLDLNWLIPEIIDYVEYKKGPYYAEYGDFSSAGGADFHLARTLPRNFALATVGAFDYYRAVIGQSTELGPGNLMFAYESVFNNGPWVVAEQFNKFNGVLRYTAGDADEGFSLSALGYRAYWTATNQIPETAVADGLVGRFGSLDPSDGGVTDRVTANGEYWRNTDWGRTRANIYTTYYDLNLYSNFTFFLDDPNNGDQIQQVDKRVYSGVRLSHEWDTSVGMNTVGLQFRNDNIYEIALNHTSQRQLIDETSHAAVNQQAYSLYAANETWVTGTLKTYVGMRSDWYRFHAFDELNSANTNTESAALLTPKTGIIWNVQDSTDLFINWGLGFHSNDARGVTAAVDPANPLVRSNGSELGMRTWITPQWQSTLTAWYLELNSELVFVGDAGTTEPASASHRGGIETANYYQVNDRTLLDVEYAWVRPRLQGGERIPNAVENVLSAGLSFRDPQGGLFGTVRVQSYGPAALIEDNSAART